MRTCFVNKIMKTLCVLLWNNCDPIPKISPYTYTNILWFPEIQTFKQFYPKKFEWRISNLSCPVYNRCWLAITWLDKLISSWLCHITAWLSSKWKQSAIFPGQCKLIRRNRQWCRMGGALIKGYPPHRWEYYQEKISHGCWITGPQNYYTDEWLSPIQEAASMGTT